MHILERENPKTVPESTQKWFLWLTSDMDLLPKQFPPFLVILVTI